jgi:hypothetical protein
MRVRRMLGAAAAAAVCVTSAAWATAPAQAAQSSGARLCTWGGTPVSPTGHVTLSPGATNTPSTQDLKLYATGDLAGGGPCTGTMTFHGFSDAGGTCAETTFHGKVEGVPGIATFRGAGVVGLVHEFLYDQHGNVVGSDQPDVLTPANATDPNDPLFTDCNTPDGFTGGTFSATVELYG